MAYYCIITSVTRTTPAGWTIAYDLMDDAPTPDAVVSSGSLGLPFDAALLDPTVSAAEKRRFVIDRLEAYFREQIDQVRAGDAAFAQLQAALTGRRYPAA